MVWTMLLDPGKFTITLFWNSAMEKTSVFHNVFQCFRILENVLVTEKKAKLVQTGGLLESLLQVRKSTIFAFLWAVPMCCTVFSEDAYKTQVRIDDEPAYLDILDTAGQVSSFPM